MEFVVAESDPYARDIDYDMEGVEGVVLLQSANVLRQPGVLVRSCEAVRQELPITCVHLEGKGYDFGAAAALLASLDNELTLREFYALEPYLQSRQITFEALSGTLARRVPAIIAVPLDPAGSAAQLDAAAVESGRKLKQAKGSGESDLSEVTERIVSQRPRSSVGVEVV